MLGNIVIYLIGILIVVDFVLMFVYCRVMEKIDVLKYQNKVQIKNMNNKTQEKRQSSKSVFKCMVSLILEHYLYGLMRYSLLCVGKIPSHRIRNWIYRFVFNMKITKNTVINGGCEIRSPWNIKADNCVIFTGCILDGRNGIIIEQNVVFGSGVHIWTEEHDVDDPYFAVNPQNRKAVIVKERAWVCSDSTILPGVIVGEGAVIASRACVTKNCDEYGIYGGVPAKKIKERNRELVYQLSGKPHWHFY